MEPLLEIQDLSVHFLTEHGTVQAVRGCSLSVEKGKTLGLVGESGCGKTVTAYSILNLVPHPGEIAGGSIYFKGRDLRSCDQEELRKIRGGEIAMIFQEPMASLNPVYTAGYQIIESLRLHQGLKGDAAREHAVELLRLVGIPSPETRIDSYPHELSGGMCQRVMIAMALAGEPELLIADEPTTALDVTIQAQILDLMIEIQKRRGMSLLLISHDLGVVSSMSDNIAIMYAGEIVESGSSASVISEPLHPYTKGLISAIPSLGSGKERLYTIPGTVPSLTETPEGCVFYSRCENRSEKCLMGNIRLEHKKNGHYVRCVNV